MRGLISRRWRNVADRATDRKSINAALHILSLEDRSMPSAFTPGDLLVYRIGDGNISYAQGNSGKSAPIFADEYSPTGTLVQTVALPTTASGAQLALTGNIDGSADGMLTLSGDGRFVTVPGFNNAPITSSTAATATLLGRGVGFLAADGSVDTKTTTGSYVGAVARSVATYDGTQFWTAGSASTTNNGGVRYFGSTGATAGTGTYLFATGSSPTGNGLTNDRTVALGFDNRLYLGTGAGSPAGIHTFASARPTTAEIATLSATYGTSSPYQFSLADVNQNGVLDDGDRLYIADDNNTASSVNSVQRFTYSAGAWGTATRLDGSVSGLRGLTSRVVGGNVELYGTTFYITSPTGAYMGGGIPTVASGNSFGFTSSLLKMVDDGVSTPAWSNINTTSPVAFNSAAVATSQKVQRFAGVSFVPGSYKSTAGTVTSNVSSATVGQAITFTATFTASAGTPSGTASYYDGTTLLGTSPVTAGTSSFVTSALGGGVHAISAVFNSSTAGFRPSTSNTLSQTVAGSAASMTTIAAAPTTTVYGQTVTFTATVSGATTPTGTVTFTDGSTILGTSILVSAGPTVASADLAVTSLFAATHTITATYNGDNTFAGSNGNISYVVSKATTDGVLSSSISPSTTGQGVVFTATLAAIAPGAGVPTGVVTFLDGSTVLGTATVNVSSTATFTTTRLLAGTHTLTASYAGDANFTSVVSPAITQYVTGVNVTTSTPNAAPGTTVAYTATITGGNGTPTGTVQFSDNGIAIGSPVPLTGAAATTSLAYPAAGGHYITADFLSGDTGAFANATGYYGQNIHQDFTPGNIIVDRVGAGVATLSNAAAPVYLDEFSTTAAGSTVNSLILPVGTAGANPTFTDSGSASSDGMLSRSLDGRYLTLTGYASTPNLTGVASTAAATTARLVGRVDAFGNIDVSTRITDSLDANNVRAAATDDGTHFWVAGAGVAGTAGLRYTTLGGSGATVGVQNEGGATVVFSPRVVQFFGGNLYMSSPFAGGPLVQVGTGVSGAASQTVTPLPGITSLNIYGFAFFDLDATVPGVDTLYAADSSAGLVKYGLVGGTWTIEGSSNPTGGLFGLAAIQHGSSIDIYGTTTGTPGNKLVKFTDAAATSTSALSGSFLTLATAPANTFYHGVTFAPAPAVTSVATNNGDVQRSTVKSITVNFNSAVTLAPDAFTLTRPGFGPTSPTAATLRSGTPATGEGRINVSTSIVAGKTVATLTFATNAGLTNASADGVDFGSLSDGSWVLKVNGTGVTVASGDRMAADFLTDNTADSLATATGRIYRLFGNIDGDTDVDLTDLSSFRTTLTSVINDPTTPPYNSSFDFDADGDVDLSDLSNFRSRFALTV